MTHLRVAAQETTLNCLTYSCVLCPAATLPSDLSCVSLDFQVSLLALLAVGRRCSCCSSFHSIPNYLLLPVQCQTLGLSWPSPILSRLILSQFPHMPRCCSL
ncbi:hypothetical protein M758_5G192400 [Ceratodon purpureus]|nr:hypothetical protein M758_5G192400 [Ceratodon purpureus]